MKTQKKFDCVKMKDEIQARLLAEYRGLSDEEITRRIHRKLEASDSPVARWWRAIVARDTQSVATGGRRKLRGRRRPVGN
jgi:hypothetical protein